jgi:VCBS repeat-containing protein
VADETLYGTNGNDTLSGGNGKDTIHGLDGDDIISGGNGVDNLFGDGGDDQLTGDNGADHLTGGADDDVLDGALGFDTAYYSGAIGEYSFFSAAGYLHIVHLGGAGADGHDQVKNVERLVFADRTIDIGSGTNAPVAGDDFVALNEDSGPYSSGSASVLDNDFDFDGDALTVTGGTFVGTYGTLTLNADGTYSYALNNSSVQGLDDGETVADSFNYTVSDNDGSDTGTLTFTIAGLNDAPVANDDTASTDEDTPVAGNVLANDTDIDGETLVVANPGTYVGAYGTLVLAADGSYTYTANAAGQALDDGEVVNDAFAYTASDGTATDSATLTVTLAGLNDAPVANDDTASTDEDTAVSGNVLGNDTDVDVEPLTVTNPGTYSGIYGTLVLAADGSYTYTPNAAANGLAAGETAQDAFGYTASDGTASDTATLTVTVNGTNDAPTIDAGGTDASGSVTKLPNNDPNENAFTHADSGTIAFDDADLTDTHSASFTPLGGGYLGTFTLDPVNQAGDSVGWDFSVEDSAIDFLDEGETLTQIYMVEIDDGNGGTTTQDVTVTITGAADSIPPDGTNWYIDNSAVGSAETGSPSDPFTSIAAFNAAQGTPGGPGVGDNVFLLAGTGVYSEADGINLLDGQTLTGVAAGPLRPTIVVTGAGNDGIELAQDNTITGLDIGNTADAGIVDGNGSVGTLTISDVGKSGTGQIVDIDQGGTLNVTLNSAESLASNDGAIDLAGVGGSFTVTGATTITGIHSDGGIDITGSSLTATFAGGGTVSTNNAIAVNFVGNTGALALGGGFDIVTTTGNGLVATGGGTVTATGTGNSVTTLTGVAITVNGTAIGAADLTFESVSANGGAYGIRLNSTGSAGGLHITGTGSTDGSGGTIQNTTTRGIELIDTAEVVIDNVALTNANTANGTSTDLDVSNSNAAIFMSGVAGASFANVDISTAADSGVVGINVADFVMAGSTITLAGNALNESGMEFVNLSGDSSVSDSTISFSETNALDIVNTDVNLNLVLDNVTFSDSQTTSSGGPTNPNGEGGLQFRSFSTAAGAPVTNIDVIDSDFTRIRTQGIQVFGNDDSVISLDVTNNAFDSQAGAGTAIDLNASGTAQVAFNVIGNTISSRSGNAINVTAFGGGDVEGRINDNVITANTSGSGIRVVAQDNGSTAIVEARDNSVTMGTGNSASAIDVLARFGNARLDLTLDGNTLDSNTTALADINITAGASASGETASVYANIINNVVLAGGPTNVLRLRTADLDATSDPRIFLEGFIEAGPGLDDDAVATWNANGNTPLVTATQVNVNQTAGATAPSAGTAQVPDNAEPLMAQSLAGRGTAGGDLLDQAALDTAVGAAIQLFAEAGASAEQLAAIQGVSFAVADLAGLDLGLHTGEGVLMDGDAAGYGWALDAGGSGMDLLSVVMHELGHAIGFGDHYSAAGQGDLMHGYLAVGEHRSLDGVFETGASGQSDWGSVATSQPDMLSYYHEIILM